VSNVFPFRRRRDQDEGPGSEVARIDVDGDGVPDLITGPGTPLPDPAGDPSQASQPYNRRSAQGRIEDVGRIDPSQDLLGSEVAPADAADLPATVHAQILARRDADRAPVLPAWARSRVELRAIVRWLARFYGHTVAFHAVRVPLYGARTALRAPRGLLRSVGAVSRWLSDAEAGPLRADAVRRADAKEYQKLASLRADRQRWRWTLVLAGSVAAVVLLSMVLVLLPGWVAASTALALVLVLALVGTDPDRPLVGHAVTKFEAPKLTTGMIEAALGSIGLAGINQALGKNGAGIGFPAPITRDGEGWRADIDLPLGVTALEVAERREKLASGLRRPSGAVWPERDPDPGQHDGRLILWVGDKPMSQAKQPPWPLAKTGAADLFKPIPYGFDQRGRLVSVELMFSNLLVGAIPRQGKTFAVRVFALAAALDPIVELHCHELKGTGDLSSVEGSCHRYTAGPPAEDTLTSVMRSLREVHSYLDDRARTIGRLPKDLCPESKITPLLSGRRELRLWPVVLIVDECQELFESEYGTEATTLAKAIIKRGPAMGIMLILATQRPDRDALPPVISSSMGARLCLKVMDQVANDMILGTSSYKAGMRATTLTDQDKGVGYLRDGGTAKVVRSAYIDGPAAAKIGARARAQREAVGLLSGHAIGQAPTDEVTITINVINDVRAVFKPDETGLWNEVILGRLRELRPGHYANWSPAGITAALKSAGIEASRQIERVDPQTGERKNRRGVQLADLQPAITGGADTGASIGPGEPTDP
jgi:S-DNA-T family DNA segregation ATPase FtsK/SpoIIIE